MKPDIQHWAGHTVFDFFTPAIRGDDFMKPMMTTYVDGKGNILCLGFPMHHHQYEYTLKALKADIWPHQPLYLGDNQWTPCRILQYANDDEEGIIMLTDPRLVEMDDEDFEALLDHVQGVSTAERDLIDALAQLFHSRQIGC